MNVQIPLLVEMLMRDTLNRKLAVWHISAARLALEGELVSPLYTDFLKLIANANPDEVNNLLVEAAPLIAEILWPRKEPES